MGKEDFFFYAPSYIQTIFTYKLIKYEKGQMKL